MFRKKHIISIHSIGSDDNENGEVSPEIISEEIRQLDKLESSEETIIANNSNLQEIEPQPTSDLATLTNDLYPSEKINTKILDNSCDRITFLNGDEEEVKLIEIGDDYIKYKRCDNLDGPTYNVSKTKVFMILYYNGKKEVIEHNAADEKPKYQLDCVCTRIRAQMELYCWKPKSL
jgi:hypothetical protein